MRTRDGYVVMMPRFRARRLQRRLRARAVTELQRRAVARMLELVIRRARCVSGPGARCPVFTTALGRRPLVMITRVRAPGRVELLYLRRGRP